MMLSGKLNFTVSKMAGLMADGRNSPSFCMPWHHDSISQ